MKNKLFKTLTVLLLTLTFISHNSLNINIQHTSEPEIRICNLGGDEEPYDDQSGDKPRNY